MARTPKIRGIFRFWWKVRSNYWFVPALVIGGCVGLAYLMLILDATLPHSSVIHLSWVYTRDPNGARALLSVISQSMMTVAGVVFSITVVALTMASNQFGPRVLKSFARDTGNQVVLGVFLGTFLYGILVMRRVEGSDGHKFVPSLSVAFGIFLAMISVAVLVYFIHHFIVEIQAETIVAAVTHDLYATIDQLFPDDIGHGGHQRQPPQPIHLDHSALQEVCSDDEGFVLSIDSERVLRLAIDCDALVRLEVKPGVFTTDRTVLARFLAKPEHHDRLCRELVACFSVGAQRTYDQDLGFALDQLGLIAVRSMSPALNAIGSAEDAIDWLRAAFVRLGNRDIPSGYRYDNGGRLRVIAPTWDLHAVVAYVLDPIRQVSQTNPSFILHTIRALAEAAALARNPVMRDALYDQIRRFGDAAVDFPQESDRRRLRTTVASLLQQQRSA